MKYHEISIVLCFYCFVAPQMIDVRKTWGDTVFWITKAKTAASRQFWWRLLDCLAVLYFRPLTLLLGTWISWGLSGCLQLSVQPFSLMFHANLSILQNQTCLLFYFIFWFWKQGCLNFESLSTDAVQSLLAFGPLQHFTAHAALKCWCCLQLAGVQQEFRCPDCGNFYLSLASTVFWVSWFVCSYVISSRFS